MAVEYFFYDLETSGLNARDDRIMQFAGIRTGADFEPIGEPYNLLVRLADDTLPSPDAIMVTGITPQKTVEEGYPEAEFCKILESEVFIPDTVIIGYNNIRFDDEFIRYLFWRNFRDPYEWSWKDGRSRWDMLDVVRMTRALRPDGIEWPFNDKGESTNRLELLTKLNGIDHANAHDALADVYALIAVTKLLKAKQPQLFDYLFNLRSKNEVKKLVNLDDKRPFVYTSGRFDAKWNKTTVAFPLAPAINSNVLVYDLRSDPADFVGLSEKELAKLVYATREERLKDGFKPLPVKVMQYNRCPAVAPISVLSAQDGWQTIGLDAAEIQTRVDILLKNPDFAERIRTIYEKKPDFERSSDPEGQLYDGFLPDVDRMRVEAVRNADMTELADFHPEFRDERLDELLLHYKARSFVKSLSESEAKTWEEWRLGRISKQLPGFMSAIERLGKTTAGDDSKAYLLEELSLWLQSIAPSETEQ